MACILVAPIQGGNTMCLGDHEEQEIFSCSLGHWVQVQGPQWIMKFSQLFRIRLPPLLEVCSARSTSKSVCFCVFSQSNTVLNTGSSLWAPAQSVTCILTNGWPVATHTFCSKYWSPSTMAGLWTLAWCTIPKVTPSRMDFTVSGSSRVVTWLSMLAMVLSCHFWYSNSKLNLARAPTHQWPVSRLGVSIMYVSRLLSIQTKNGW